VQSYTFNASRPFKKALLAGSSLPRPIIASRKYTVQRGKSTNKANSRIADWHLLPFIFLKMQLSAYINPQISMQAHTHLWAGPKLLLLQSFACFHLKTPWRQRVCARLLLSSLTWATCAVVLYLASSSLSAASWCPGSTA